MTLTVHHLQVGQSERITWLCEELEIPYKLVLHHRDPIFSPQSIKDLSPIGQAPIIQDGDLTLFESAACVEYIIRKYFASILNPTEGTDKKKINSETVVSPSRQHTKTTPPTYSGSTSPMGHSNPISFA